MAERAYKPDELVPLSGLYLVTHREHRRNHESTLFAGESFPSCSRCGDHVRFRLVRAAVPILEDADFRPAKARAHIRGHH